MTARVRKLALGVGGLLAILIAISAVRRAQARKAAEPLAQAYVDFLNADLEAYGGLLDAVKANGSDCAKTRSLGLAVFDRLEPRHADALGRIQSLRAAANSPVVDAASQIAAERMAGYEEKMAARHEELPGVLDPFKKRCPSEAGALDERLLQYAGSGSAPR